MSTVITIVSDHLRAIGADGLVCPDADCGCVLSDIAPCGGDIGACQPGYRSLHSDDEDWRMWSTKELAEAENARIKAEEEGGAT